MALQTDYVDSLVLHGPYGGHSITNNDWEVWSAMEEQQKNGSCRLLGVSNISAPQLKQLYDGSKIKPSIVQNRCFAAQAWDYDVREICRDKNIVYQGFSLLTANSQFLFKPSIQDIADRYEKTIPQLVFRFSLQMGMLPLTGTTDEEHMKQDLDIFGFELTKDEVQILENIASN